MAVHKRRWRSAFRHAPEPFGFRRSFPDEGGEGIPRICCKPGRNCGGNGSIVMGYQYDQNNYMDSQFLKNRLERTQEQEETIIFVNNESGTKVLKCPAGQKTKSCGHTGEKPQQFYVSFRREQCAGCQSKDRCKAKLHKRVSSVTASVKAHERTKQQKFMGTNEFCNSFRICNGVETVPSMLRRLYHADRMPVRELLRGRFFFD